MRDLLDDLVGAWRRGEPAGLATVTATWSSAPRQPGAAMLVRADGTAASSVSGGCVESAVYQLCREVAGSGQPRTARYGVNDDDAAEVGLPCGGMIDGMSRNPVIVWFGRWLIIFGCRCSRLLVRS